MKLPQSTICNTCTYLISRYQSEIKEGFMSPIESYISALSHLSGISILLIGHPEQKHVKQSIELLKVLHQENHIKLSAVAARSSAHGAAEIGQGGN